MEDLQVKGGSRSTDNGKGKGKTTRAVLVHDDLSLLR